MLEADPPAAPIVPARNRTPADLERELHDYMVELLAPAPRMEVYQWAEANIALDERTSPIPGRFSTQLTPYIREPLQCYADKTITDLTLCFGTQTAKTTVVMIGTAYRIVNDPMPVLWVMPNQELAKSFSKTRWLQMVNDCAPLAAQKPEDRHLFGFLEQHFAKVTLNFVGSNSASNLASRPAGLLNMDETDKFKLETDREAGALQLAEERTKNFPYPLRVKTSTPTTAHGEIWKEFKLGDQRYYHVPCPHCTPPLSDVALGQKWDDLGAAEREHIRKHYIVLKFRVETEQHGECGLRWWNESPDEVKTDGDWDYEKVRKAAHYRCQYCGGKILEHHKTWMLRRGVWMPTHPNAERRRRSYHLSSLYSLISRECTFSELSVKWLQTKGSITKRHGYINSTLAETWDDEKAVDDNPIFREAYNLDSVPAGVTRIMSVDVQEGHFWVLVRDFAGPTPDKPNGESWMHLFDRIETIEEVAAIQREFGVDGKFVVLDMAHRPTQVAKWCVQYGWRALWGDDKNGFIHALSNGYRVTLLWSPVKFRDPHLGTAQQGDRHPHAMYCQWANNPIKDVVTALRYSQPPIFHVHAAAHKDYQRHMNAEQRILQKRARSGGYFYAWHQFSRNNHGWDCECMAAVRAMQAGLVPAPDGVRVPMQGELNIT